MYKSSKSAEERGYDAQARLFGARYVGASLGQIQLDEQSNQKILEFTQKPKHFLVFLGNPGIGKTHLCAAFMPWAAATFDSFRYWHEDKLLQTLRDRISEGKGDYFKHLSMMIDDQFVIIDDVGCNKQNEWREEVLFEAINLRYNSMLPTVITSNLSKDDFYKAYHPRIGSRIFAKENLIIELPEEADWRAMGK